MTKTMHKYFGCSCMSLRHMISVIYFPPIEENSRKDEDDVIYLSITSENFRKNIIPQFWDKFFWEQLFDKDLKVNFYYGSIWKRFQIAYNYLVRNKEPQGGVLDCISLFSSYKEDILEFLSVFNDNKNESNKYFLKIGKLPDTAIDTEAVVAYVNEQQEETGKDIQIILEEEKEQNNPLFHNVIELELGRKYLYDINITLFVNYSLSNMPPKTNSTLN